MFPLALLIARVRAQMATVIFIVIVALVVFYFDGFKLRMCGFGRRPKIDEKLLRTVFDRYNIISSTTNPHDTSATLSNNINQRNGSADEYEAPSS